MREFDAAGLPPSPSHRSSLSTFGSGNPIRGIILSLILLLQIFAVSVLAWSQGSNKNADNARLYFKKGIELENQFKTEESIAPFQEAVKLDPTNAEYQFHLGYAYHMNSDWEHAAAAYKQAVRLEGSGQQYNGLGYVLFKKGDYKESAAAYEQAVNKGYKWAWTIVGYAKALAKAGRVTDAVIQANAAVAADPKNELIRAERDKIVPAAPSAAVTASAPPPASAKASAESAPAPAAVQPATPISPARTASTAVTTSAAPPFANTLVAANSAAAPAAAAAAKPTGAYFEASTNALILPRKSGTVSIGVPAEVQVTKVETTSSVVAVTLSSSLGESHMILRDTQSCPVWSDSFRKLEKDKRSGHSGAIVREIPSNSGVLEGRWFNPAYGILIAYIDEQSLEGCLDVPGGPEDVTFRDTRKIPQSAMTQFSVNIAQALLGSAAPAASENRAQSTGVPQFVLNAVNDCKLGIQSGCRKFADIQPTLASCDAGQNYGIDCYVIAELARERHDPTAKAYYSRACDQGFTKACKKAK